MKREGGMNKTKAAVKNTQSLQQATRLRAHALKGRDLLMRLGATKRNPVKMYSGHEQLSTRVAAQEAGKQLGHVTKACAIDASNRTGTFPLLAKGGGGK